MKYYDLYTFLDMVGNIEILVEEQVSNFERKSLMMGYPEELQEHLEVTFSTTRYKVIYIQGVRKDEVLTIVVVEEE